jgi:hypothetical protein
MPSPGMMAWLALLLISAALLWASVAPYQSSEPDETFQQLFSWG